MIIHIHRRGGGDRGEGEGGREGGGGIITSHLRKSP